MNKLDETIQFSTNRGLMWMVKNQNEDGSFGELYPVTTTALAILAFVKQAQKQCVSVLDPSYMFNKSVDGALKYIFSNTNISPNGIYFDDYGSINMPTGTVLAALSSLGCEDFLIAFNEYLPINGYTINQLKAEISQYLAWSQNPNGGWGDHNSDYDMYSNNTVTGYVVLGLLMEACYGTGIPKSIIPNLKNWVEYIQNPVSGGAGGFAPDESVNILNTGNLIQEMFLIGYQDNNNNLKLAKRYVANNWSMPSGYLSPGWNNYPVADYQATFAITIGLALYSVEYIKTSSNTCIYWKRDIMRVLLSQQQQDGSWPASKIKFEQSDQMLSTVWAILTLQYIIACNL